jgi:hypothetical protein
VVFALQFTWSQGSKWRTKMRRIIHDSDPTKLWHRLAIMLVLAVAEASAQQKGSPDRRIVISIPDRKVAVVEDGHVICVYPVAVGAHRSPSPTGEFRVTSRITKPTYYHPGVVIPPGKNNPLGTRWIGLDRKGYGIHGTNEPRSIGHAASHGCIRMARTDLEQLFELVQVGDAVEIRSQRDAELDAMFGATAVSAVQAAGSATSAGGQL